MTTPSTPQSVPTTSAIKVDPKAIQATVIRYAVPTLVGLAVSTAAKAGFSIDASQAYGIVAPAVATAYSGLAHFLEAKFPVLNRILGAQKPATLTK